MFCLTGPTSDLLTTGQRLCRTLYFYVDQKSKMAAITGQIEFNKRSYGKNYLKSICLNLLNHLKGIYAWIFLGWSNPQQMFVFWANKNSKIVAIAGQSFNIGPYWGNWIDICFQKLQTFDYTLYTNDHWMVPHQSLF